MSDPCVLTSGLAAGLASTTFADSTVPGIVHAEDGEILAVNGAFEAATGYAHRDVPTISSWVERAYGKDNAAIVEAEVATIFGDEGLDCSGGYQIRCQNGALVTWAFYSMPLGRLSDGRRAVMSMGVDLTEREETRQRLERTARALRTLGLSNRLLLRARDEQGLAQGICDLAVREGGYSLAWIGPVDREEGDIARPVALCSSEFGVLDPARVSWGGGLFGEEASGRAAHERRPVVVPDLAPCAGLASDEAAGAHPHGSAACFPMSVADEVVSVFCVCVPEPNGFAAEEVRFLTELASGLSFGIEAVRARARGAGTSKDLVSVNERLARTNEQLEGQLRDLAIAMGKAIEERDPHLHGHQERTAAIATALARGMGMSKHEIAGIETAALLHDIGKLSVPAEILHKPGKLSDAEYALVQGHCQSGYRILEHVSFPWPVAKIVLQHHERIDGSGYPRGLEGDEILTAARVLAVADVMDAMASSRPYRPVLGMDGILDELYSGGYDEDVVCAAERIYGLYGLIWEPSRKGTAIRKQTSPFDFLEGHH